MAIIEIFPLEELETIMDFLVLHIEVNYSKDLFKQVPAVFPVSMSQKAKVPTFEPTIISFVSEQ